ncbi:MAG: PhoH family protein, partial [Desulfobacteraceae bacterium]|nr:PhoH family protein [Desulfobacteraceae bacterium]
MKTMTFEKIENVRELFGQHNANLANIAQKTGTTISARGNTVSISGKEEAVILAEKVLDQLYQLVDKKFSIEPADIEAAIKTLKNDITCDLKSIFLDTILTTESGKPIAPKTSNQKKYVEALRENDILFAIGPAGTGKTYLAMAMAVAAFARGEVKKIILTRPAVEAGEALGFLPGDLAEKINPYLRPLYDALYEMFSFQKTQTLIEQGMIEIAPLAFMRGRTLNNAFIILDEAQNTTSEQMKMFLTRIGFSSRAIVTGDITQTDLPSNKKSGLVEAKKLLYNIKGIKILHFSKNDIVRHELVSKIIEAYEQ